MTAQGSLFSRLLGLVTRLNSTTAPTQREVDRRMLDVLYADFDRKVDALALGLDRGTVTVGQFTGAMPSLIRQHQLAAAVIASGGADQVTPQTMALAQRQVDTQLAYFERWKAELLQQAVDGKLPSAEAIAARAKLYGRAAKTTAEQTSTAALGVPPLPWYVGQGSPCRVNCKCRWDIEVLDVVNANFDCYWYVNEEAEHCPVCVMRSRVANPLRVRRGRIVDPERYQAAGLFV